MGTMKWSGKSIGNLSVFQEVSVFQRLDVLPFSFFYGALFGATITNFWSAFVCKSLLISLISTHVMVFLLQHWSLKAKVFITMSRRTVMPKKVPKDRPWFVLVVPAAYRRRAELVPLRISNFDHLFFEFQKCNYVYSSEKCMFEQVFFPVNLPVREYLSFERGSYGGNVPVDHRRFMFGRNCLTMPAPTFMELYKQHLLAPFFVFQAVSILLWVFEDQWQYSAMTFCMMLVFEATVCQGRLRTLRELRGMRNKPTDYYIYQNRKWATINSLDLLPGDIISVKRSEDDTEVVPCDVLLLASSAVVDEAMLTGESVPVVKDAVATRSEDELAELLSTTDKHKMNILHGGTKVLKIDAGANPVETFKVKPPDGGAICYVLRTGFGTSQGELLKTILYSSESVSANSWEAAAFILFLLLNAMLASGYVLYHRYSQDVDVRYKLLLRCILIITSVVPPELPMQLALAVNTSLISLVQNEVFCTEPFRIPWAGKVDVCCFDKTGTLTMDNINAVGVSVLPEDSDADVQEWPLIPIRDGPSDAQIVLGACHSLLQVNDQLVGDPLELSALKSVEWNVGRTDTCFPKRGGTDRLACRILHRFRFSSELQRMSVVVHASGSLFSGRRILAKGSPEKIMPLLASVPEDCYRNTARSLTRRGLRVLALAYKDIDESISSRDLSCMERSEAESGLKFAGFVCFESPLRIDSRRSIRKLKRANHRIVMITGDSTLTATHVAVQVGMVSKPVLILEKNGSALEWVSASTGKRKKRYDVMKLGELALNFDLCLSGPTLELAIQGSPSKWQVIEHISIFARVTPGQKELIVITLKQSGLYTLMCGDGTNDVGALKQAHVGVALLSTVNKGSNSKSTPDTANSARKVQQEERPSTSESGTNARQRTSSKVKKGKGGKQGKQSKEGKSSKEAADPSKDRSGPRDPAKEYQELMDSMDLDQAPLVKLGDASIASPFTSRRMTIDSCVAVIRQGRCTLATTLQMYQILALNGLIQAFSLSVLYLEGVSFGEKQMTVTGICMAVAFFMVSRSKSAKKLSVKKPPSTIFAPELFISLLLQFGIHVFFLITSVRIAKEFVPEGFEASLEEKFEPSVYNTIIFLVSVMQQVSVMLVNYTGRPYMERLVDNKGLLYSLVSVIGIIVLCVLEVMPDVNEFMQCAPWPSHQLKFYVLGIIFGDLFLSVAAHRTITFISDWFKAPKRIVSEAGQ